MLNFTNFGRDNEVRYGLELNGMRTVFEYVDFRNYDFSRKDDNTEITGFVRWKRKIGPLVIEPGFRVQYYARCPTFPPTSSGP